VELGEAGEGAVVALFDVGGKDAGGELVVFEVVGDAFAALALAGAGFIAAGAAGFVGFEIAFHRVNSNLWYSSVAALLQNDSLIWTHISPFRVY